MLQEVLTCTYAAFDADLAKDLQTTVSTASTSLQLHRRARPRPLRPPVWTCCCQLVCPSFSTLLLSTDVAWKRALATLFLPTAPSLASVFYLNDDTNTQIRTCAAGARECRTVAIGGGEDWRRRRLFARDYWSRPPLTEMDCRSSLVDGGRPGPTTINCTCISFL